MAKSKKGRAVFYHRDSGGEHEMTPNQYLEWAQGEARKYSVVFRGSYRQFEQMVTEKISALEDIFLDYIVPGDQLSRDGLNALIKEIDADKSITHLIITRPDRLARPKDPIDAVKIENDLRRKGITLVFRDKVLQPLARGQRAEIGETISSIVSYEEAGKFSPIHAQKMIDAQIGLAKKGRSTGGRAPYGFRRYLVADNNEVIRELKDGEILRMAGHHTVLLPGSQEELDVIRRICDLLEENPASRVAKILTDEGIPTPDQGRTRTDNGVTHHTSGIWHANTVTNIARNPLNVAMKVYGRRGMGKNLRYTPDGPRELEDSDFRDDIADKPKVIVNDASQHISAECLFEPIINPERHRKLIEKLDQRGQSQRGKPRSRDPNNNPLGSRIYDMNCGGLMYRNPYKNSFKYKCGLYQQSHGAICSSNGVDGPTATSFVLGSIQQRVLEPSFLLKIEDEIRKIAADGSKHDVHQQELANKRSQLAKVEAELAVVSKNMARAKSEQQYEAIAAEYDSLLDRQQMLEKHVVEIEKKQPQGTSEKEIAAAMAQAKQLVKLASQPEDMAAASEVIRLANAKLYLKFHPVKQTKRYVNRVESGIATFGSAPTPIKIYEGPTSREKLGRSGKAKKSHGSRKSRNRGKDCCSSEEDGKSIGNVNRADRS